MVATRRTSTRLAVATSKPTPPVSKRKASTKRTHVSDSESEDGTISVAGSSKPAPKRFRASAATSSSGIEVSIVISEASNEVHQESGSTSEEDTKPSDSYANSVDDAADTPATTISSRSSSTTRNKGKGKAVATTPVINRRTTRLSAVRSEIVDSQDEEDDEVEEPEEDGSELSEPDYEDDEISAPPPSAKSKGKGKAKAGAPRSTPAARASARTPRTVNKGKGKATASRAPSVAPGSATEDDALTDLPEDVDDSSDSEFTDQGETSEAEDDIFAGAGGFLREETEDAEDAGPSIAAPVRRQRAARPSRARRGGPRRTREENTRYQLYMQHPELKTIWDELDAKPKITVEKDKQPDGLSLTMLPFQLEGLHWLRCQEETGFKGGILADEMGMGKTIQTIGLLMSEPRAKPNLVIAPTVALVQWKNEIEKHTNNALSVVVYHGANREVDAEKLAEADVIMTTYSVLESVYRKQTTGFKRKDGIYKEDSALHKIKFHRVILDEAHNIKDRSSKSARAAFALQTKYKLCLSGTPLQNRIGELFSLLRFLEADPFSYYYCRNCPCKSLNWKFTANRGCDDCGHSPMHHLCFFNHELLKPIQNNGNEGPGKEAFAKLQILLKHIMLRRTKEERADDLGLPPKIVKVRRDYFNEEELDLYDSIYGDSKRQFNTYVAHGVVLNNYANIFTLITRMRQLADHPDLVLKKQAENGQNTLVCSLCDDEAEDAIKSRCHHTFCRLCVQEYIDGFDGENNPDCPKCHISLNIDLTQPAIEADYTVIKKNSIINRIDMSAWRSSTKIEALVEELYKLRSKNHTIKSIVFSQFTSMLQLVEWRLRKAGFQTAMLEGSMTPAQRNATISHFMENIETTVFLVSLKAGGVALNLIEASQVFIMDPWWNPSVEWQAADRIHRIGQTRACKVTRLVIEDSIESRILDLQEKKARMIHATVGADQAAMDKLTPADMQFLFQN